MVRRSRRRPAFRVLAYSTAAALVAVGLTSVAAAADPEPAGPATSTSTGTATTPPVAPSTTSPTTAPTSRPDAPPRRPPRRPPPSTSPTPTTSTTGSADPSTPPTSTSPSTPSQGLAPAQVAADPIDDRYAALGGATGALGRTVGGRVAVAGGQVQAYEHGHISWSARTGAWETLTAVDARFQTISGPSGALGFPTRPRWGSPGDSGSGSSAVCSGGAAPPERGRRSARPTTATSPSAGRSLSASPPGPSGRSPVARGSGSPPG